jgi:hypothetical protein
MHKWTQPQLDWLAALRSGEFNQTIGRLKDKTGYCCLGVACETSNLGQFDAHNRYVTDESVSVSQLGQQVAKHLRMKTLLGSFYTSEGRHRDLSYLNDTLGYSFAQIADHIEKHATELFYEH